MINPNSLIISIDEARKILGKEARYMNDDQIIDIILTLTDLAANVLRKNKVPENE